MSEANKLIDKTLATAFAVAKQTIIATACVALPFLKIPVISSLFKWGVSWVLNQLEPLIEIWFKDTLVDIEVTAQLNAFNQAKEELEKVLKAQVKDPKDVENVSKIFDDRLANLIRFKP